MTAFQPSPSPTLRFLAPLMLALAAASAVANWYLEPAGVSVWAVLVVMTVMALVLWLLPRGMAHAAATRGWTSSMKSGVDSVRSAIVFASLMMLAAMVPNLLESLGLDRPALDEIDKRGTMVLLGLFMASTGNAMPKTLTPLSATACEGDVARSQAFQRFFGWTWTLMGLAFSIVWLTLPLDLAKPVSVTFVFGAILIVATAMVRLVRAHRRDRTDSPARP